MIDDLTPEALKALLEIEAQLLASGVDWKTDTPVGIMLTPGATDENERWLVVAVLLTELGWRQRVDPTLLRLWAPHPTWTDDATVSGRN